MPIEGLALVELDELPAGHEALALAQLAQPWIPRSRWSGSSVLRKLHAPIGAEGRGCPPAGCECRTALEPVRRVAELGQARSAIVDS